ncbi:MAG TPA: tetratricopeptide repeat protein [Anaerolineales bacterium]|nr:tetratricopeptide repeat protein [Anaerolineales bacterium]
MPTMKGETTFGNLPVPVSTFIGRERERKEVQRLLLSNRLVTLTGPGGCGKTRLALKVAQGLMGEFEQRVWFIELASVTDPVLVPQTIAAALNIREQSRQSLMDVLTEYLSLSPSLLVIDNCEHLILTCAHIVETLLQKCPDLKILVTSREVLGIIGEVAWIVPPLSLPDQQPWVNPAGARDAVRSYQESESVQLFVRRAEAIAPDFQLTAENGSWVAEICRRLDGMPLAIELAAARVRMLSVHEIAQRLDDRFNLLTGGSRTAPLRHQTLAATLDWSYALLSDLEQKVLQGLSIFASGGTLSAIEAVCTSDDIQSTSVLDTLSRLVDKSLVTVERPGRGETRYPAGGSLRYRLLETIRQYAREKLVEAGQLDEARDRYLDYFLQWVEKAEPHLNGPEQGEWLDGYEAEHDNLRAALEWCNADPGKAPVGLQLAMLCGRFWRLHGYLSEGRMHLSAALSRAGAQERNISRAQALTLVANLAYLQSDYPAMRPVAEEALSIWRELGEAGKAGAAFTLDLLGELATEEGDYERAPILYQEALEIYKELDDLRGISQIHMQFGWTAIRTGDYEQAQKHLEEFLRLSQQLGDKMSLAYALSGLGEVSVRQGQYERAISLLEQGLALSREHGDKWGTGTLLGSLGWVAFRQHDFKQMRQILAESLAVRLEINDKGGIAWCLERLAEAKNDQAQFAEAAKIFGHAESVRAPIGSVIDPADQPEYRRIISGLRSGLGQEAFAALWAEGAVMRLEEVIKCALSESEAAAGSTRADKEKFGGLTRREREVAALIAQGKSNREIAEVMTVGVKTVETYVTRILNKLGFDSRVQIATWAVEKGLITSKKNPTSL